MASARCFRVGVGVASLSLEQRHANYNHKVLYNTKHCDCD